MTQTSRCIKATRSRFSGNCRTLPSTAALRALRTGSWGLRDYGTGLWDGGNPDCDHAKPTTTYNQGFNERWGQGGGQLKQEKKSEGQFAQECGKCGARRVDRQLGLEPTPDEYVQSMVAVFREVRRVLKDTGTCWINLGDSYNSNESGGMTGSSLSKGGKQTPHNRIGRTRTGRGFPVSAAAQDPAPRSVLKPKDLCGIPWMLAFALRADGWYLRSEIVWFKPNPMPESVTDRPTKTHEQVFLFAKGQWKARVVALTDLHGEFVHVRDHVGAKDANVWAHEFGVRLASSVLDVAKREQQFSLPPLDAKVWQQLPGSVHGFQVADLPVMHRAAVYASRLLSANASAKEFLCELDRLEVALPDREKFLVLGGTAKVPLPPGVDRYGETAIAIHGPGQVGEVDFSAHTLKYSRPGGCSYFFDQEAVREAYQPDSIARDGRARLTAYEPPGQSARAEGERCVNGGRNVRTVWEIATQPYPEAHFATYPEELVRRCILAGTSERGVCPECGKPWERETESERRLTRPTLGAGATRQTRSGLPSRGPSDETQRLGNKAVTTKTLGWRPSCHCLCPACTIKDGHDKNMLKLRPRDRQSEETIEVLRPKMLGAMGGEGSPAEGHNDKGLCCSAPAQSSIGVEAGLCDGTSLSDGGSSRSYSREERGSSPFEREEGRQPAGELGDYAEASPRPTTEETSPPVAVPALPGEDLGDGQDKTNCASCGAPLATIPSVVLDPFLGSGTTGLVARKHGRRCIGIELSLPYAELAARRLAQQSLLAIEGV